MKTLRVLALLPLFLSPALAAAGSFSAVIVSIDRSHSVARGSLTGARINSGSEFILCSVSMQSVTRGIRSVGTCSARDARGAVASCTTRETGLLQAMLSINSASEVRFGWDLENACTFVAVVNASSNLE
jgi:hypothetical protein